MDKQGDTEYQSMLSSGKKKCLRWRSVMSTRYFNASFFLFIVMFFLPGIINAGGTNGTNNSEYIQNKILIKFYDDVTVEKKASIRKRLGVAVIKHLNEIGIEVWKIPDGKSIDDIIKELKKESAVERWERDSIYVPKSTPADSKTDEQLRLNNSGQESIGRPGTSWDRNGIFITKAAYSPDAHNDVPPRSKTRNGYLENMDLGKRLVSFYFRFIPAASRFLLRNGVVRLAQKGALFPIEIFSRLIIGFGLTLTALIASLGYLLPFTIFLIMAREKKDDEQGL
jgi:hypothetical protein